MDPGLTEPSCSSAQDGSSGQSGCDRSVHASAALDAQPASRQRDTQKQQQQQHHKLGFLSALPSKREVVRQFTPSWFTVTMGTGTVALSVAAFPFKFPGQDDICLAVWALNVALFAIFSCLMLGRVLIFPETMPHLFRHTNQSLFVGAIPMAFSTITNGVVLFMVPRHGVLASHVSQVLFWANLPAVILCIVLIPFTMATMHDHAMHSMTAVWLLPVVPACVAGNTAGVVAKAVPNERLGMTIMIIGFILLSIGFLLSYQITSIYYNRLICHKLPAREVIVSSFLPIGPMAMTAVALMNLAIAADHHLLPLVHAQRLDPPLEDEWLRQLGRILVFSAGLIASGVWGFALWWLVLAVSCIVDTYRQGIPFNLGWWGSVFPVGTVAVATCQLAALFHSKGLEYLGAVTVCAHVLLWLIVVGLTTHRAWLGKLFHAPCLHAAALAAAVSPAGPASDVCTDANSRVAPGAHEVLCELEDKLSSTGPSMTARGKSSTAGSAHCLHSDVGTHTA